MTHTLSTRPFFRLGTILSALSLVTALMAQSDRSSSPNFRRASTS